tara:strand:+ start:3575 stop:4519 length:945 start_codon:yes stop_codon:yes gene_type:complete
MSSKLQRIIKKIFKLYKLFKIDFQPSIQGLIEIEKENNISEIQHKNNFEISDNWHELWAKKIEQEYFENPETFLRCECISATIHPNEQEKSNKLLDEMLKDSYSRKHILPYLSETPFGDPYLLEKFRFASPMTIQHAYYIFLIRKYFNIFLPTSNINSIIDFGGGYGNFCKLIHQFGYRGVYNIVDFDILHRIQKKYISHNLNDLTYPNLNIKYVNLLSELDFPPHDLNSIFIASYSLSETEKSVRDVFESNLQKFNYIFIVYQRHVGFHNIDNFAYFSEIENKLKNDGEVKNIYSQSMRSYLFIYKKTKIDNK